MQEKLSEANAKFKSLEATIENLEGKVQIAMDKDWLMARKTRELDGRMNGVEAAVSWLSSWMGYGIQMIQWHAPSTPSWTAQLHFLGSMMFEWLVMESTFRKYFSLSENRECSSDGLMNFCMDDVDMFIKIV